MQIWLCADLGSAPADEVRARVRAALSATPAVVWLRPASDTSARALVSLARELLEAAHAKGGRLVVGDRLDVAIAAGADGVHLGARAPSPREARLLYAAARPDARPLVSVAVHDAFSIRASAGEADVLVLSPFKSVPGKGPALGTGRFAALLAHAPARPFVALGGVLGPDDAAEAARAGASGVALRRALLETRDPAEACSAIDSAFRKARRLDAPFLFAG